MTARPGRGLLDTRTFILLARIDDASIPEDGLISTVTLAELSLGSLVASSETERAARLAQVQVAESDFKPVPFDGPSARAFAGVAASLRRAGRKVQARTFDALIASTAIAHGLALYTCNPRDFVDIDRLELVAIRHPDATED